MTAIKMFLTKNNKPVYHSPTVRKIVFWSSNRLDKLLRMGYKIRFHVTYPNGFDNDMDIHSKDDLIWALSAFVKEYSKDFV